MSAVPSSAPSPQISIEPILDTPVVNSENNNNNRVAVALAPATEPRVVTNVTVCTTQQQQQQQQRAMPEKPKSLFERAVKIAGLFLHKITVALSVSARLFKTSDMPSPGALTDTISESSRHVAEFENSLNIGAQVMVNIKHAADKCFGDLYVYLKDLGSCFA